MKKIVKSLLALTLALGFTSCEDEQDLLFLTPDGSFQILTPSTGDGVVLSPDSPLNPGLTMTWSEANYGETPTAVTYSVEIDKTGDEFDSPLELTTTNNTFATISSDVLNSAAVAVGLTPFSEGGIDIRVSATVGAGQGMMMSNVVTYLVTTYSTDLPMLAVPGNHQGWNPPSAPRLAASSFGETDFEGFVWLDGEYKFVAPNAAGVFDWGAGPDYGDDGTNNGMLVEQDEVNCNAPAAGMYKVTANTTDLTYSATATNWGIIGAATPTGWDSDTDLVYNSTNQTLEVTLALSAGEFKFRANDDWALNFGDDNDGDGSLNQDGPNLSVSEAGTYFIVLDLSNPRMYTYSATLQ